ncbi:MAG: glutamate--tRNA ligase [Candidatus Lambdaproteobacteria bacterium RIFOXYD12_FULL_49_8]|uniref:Glutamate--tRNA ligase n=1 Tax=Candidatus Lambdaproteobacteria bacterium RIFOXYD2_FULL_50_16 TaxID=1817772 RepID=A0A1F6G9F8_9PROT|nr:MAG: glutamate--tRNA ligase [Candidatus Lambdaproteobacteria bacterium RIFOXYD2_FULL_50_16]OGG97637.1 MAG: glutamate--tRNA ligase [Candidatus Lambdaproteobacteria bacterium RIFOXYD12_FULL_49_8]
MSQPRVRFAPSPTGYLHVGGLRTCLFNYLFAKANGGTLILRFEDTDQSRKVEGAEENLLRSLSWAGIVFDEGPVQGGNFGPYVQSERLEIYKKEIDKLVGQGDAYPCFCTSEELEEMREKQLKAKRPTRYDGRCRKIKPEEAKARIEAGEPHTVRMKIIHSKGDYQVEDLIRGQVNFSPTQIDDQVLLKTDGFPTYHLASVVDDHYMGITHVIRGEEWLPSTPKHLQLYEYFGWTPPAFAHLPLLLNTDRSKLSKRQGDVATEDFRDKGFLPETLVNFVALLGWNPGDERELFTTEELIKEFSLERVGKAGSVFDYAKLEWMNQQWIKAKDLDPLLDLLAPYLPEAALALEKEKLKTMVALVRDSLTLLPNIGEKLALFLNDDPVLTDPELVTQLEDEGAKAVFRAFLEEVATYEYLDQTNFGALMKAVQIKSGQKGKGLWVPMRIAVTLVQHGPELPLVVEIFGKEKVIKMVKRALDY